MSFNVLAPKFAPASKYAWVGAETLKWENRLPRILQEVATCSPDILCLQVYTPVYTHVCTYGTAQVYTNVHTHVHTIAGTHVYTCLHTCLQVCINLLCV